MLARSILFRWPGLGRVQAVNLFVLAFCCAIFQPHLCAQQLSMPSRPVPAAQSPAKQGLSIAARVKLGEAPLSNLFNHIKPAPHLIHRLPQLDSHQMRSTEKSKRVQVGVLRPVEIDALATTSVYTVANGEVGVIGVVSEGALFTRLQLRDLNLPPGARLFIYSLKNPTEMHGPYTGRGPSADGTFWTPPVEGEGIVIEYFVPGSSPLSSETTANTFFQVSQVSHIYKDPMEDFFVTKAAGACNLPVTTEWSTTAKSVGHLQFTDDGKELICTGTLLNNDEGTLKLLTANHCFSTAAAAQSLRVYWFYNNGEAPPTSTPRTDGATLLATGADSDFTFVRLTGSYPEGLMLAGWDAEPVPVSTSVTGIHHPRGSYKRISFGNVMTDCSDLEPGRKCENYLAIRWGSGTTEGGSSGSGLWKGTPATPQLVGSLWGGQASCSTPTRADYYGSFSVTYPNISSFLTSGSPPPAPNPVSDAQFFVRQHYLDFLNREPDAAGLAYWTNELAACGSNARCIEAKRINVSAAYFLSTEFQQTGYLVHRFYKATYGRIPKFAGEFTPDTRTIGQGVVVNSSGWEQLLEGNKQAFASAWVNRAAFKSRYDSRTNEQYVDALFANTEVTPSPAERNALVAGLNNNTETRASVLRKVADNRLFYNSEFNRAFVLMQYFGYLRRNPDDAPDGNLAGYNFWLQKLNALRGDFVAAEMVKAFIVSSEYRRRFGNP